MSEIDRLHTKESLLRRVGRYKQAIKALDQMLSIDPELTLALNNKAGVLILLERFSDALPLLRKAVSIDPRNGEAWNNLGGCLARTGRHSEAIDHYVNAIERGYQNSGVYWNLGLALLATRQTARAMISLRAGLQVDPYSSEIMSTLRELAEMLSLEIRAKEKPLSLLDRLEATMRSRGEL